MLDSPVAGRTAAPTFGVAGIEGRITTRIADRLLSNLGPAAPLFAAFLTQPSPNKRLAVYKKKAFEIRPVAGGITTGAPRTAESDGPLTSTGSVDMNSVAR